MWHQRDEWGAIKEETAQVYGPTWAEGGGEEKVGGIIVGSRPRFLGDANRRYATEDGKNNLSTRHEEQIPAPSNSEQLRAIPKHREASGVVCELLSLSERVPRDWRDFSFNFLPFLIEHCKQKKCN